LQEELRELCKLYGVAWITDPSNENRAYRRVQARLLLRDLDTRGCRAEDIAMICDRLQVIMSAVRAHAVAYLDTAAGTATNTLDIKALAHVREFGAAASHDTPPSDASDRTDKSPVPTVNASALAALPTPVGRLVLSALRQGSVSVGGQRATLNMLRRFVRAAPFGGRRLRLTKVARVRALPGIRANFVAVRRQPRRLPPKSSDVSRDIESHQHG
jgi:hypothetical protein